MKVSVIVVAAGTGSRFGYERNKLFYPLCGEPVLAHTLRHIFAARSVSEVVIVHSRVDEKEIRRLVDDLHPIQPVRYALGGAEREDSVYNGLMAVSRDMDVVMVHDGARPFAGPDWYDQGAAMMETARAAIYGIPLKDTVKVRGDDGRLHTLNRSRLVAAQTPQIFHRDLLVKAHEHARAEGIQATDDASLVEALGVPVVILEGSEKNRKVTTREDIPILSLYMKGKEVQRIGTGYDVHRLKEGRRLVLGGVEIPFERGLDGHSDADVVIHAIMDALLGAARAPRHRDVFSRYGPGFQGYFQSGPLGKGPSPAAGEMLPHRQPRRDLIGTTAENKALCAADDCEYCRGPAYPQGCCLRQGDDDRKIGVRRPGRRHGGPGGCHGP